MDELRARAYLDLLLGQRLPPRRHRQAEPAPAGTAQRGRTASGGQAGRPSRPGGQARAARPGPRPRPARQPGRSRPGSPGRINLTVPLATLLGLADRPGEIPGIGPIDPGLARDLARAAAAQPQDHLVRDRHRRARPRHRPRLRPARTQDHARRRAKRRQTRPAGRPRPARRPATARARVRLHPPPARRAARRIRHLAARHRGPRAAGPAGRARPDRHRRLRSPVRGRGHDPGVKLRHLSQVRHATCTGPICRRPVDQAAISSTTSRTRRAAGRVCVMAVRSAGTTTGSSSTRGGRSTSSTPGTFRWTTPSGRQYTTEPTRYPI